MSGRTAHLTSATTTRYAARFRCIGTECEDSCCAFAWRVLLDRSDYARLKAALAGTPAERARFDRGCTRSPGAADGRPFAILQRTADGRCVFLEPDGLCSVQSAHGSEALPAVCAAYPRVATRCGDALALTTALSCPEAARLCLLADDALELEAADPGPLDHLLVRHHVPARSDDPFVRCFLEIRGAVLAILGRRDLPVPSRLFAVLHLAGRLDDARRSARGAAGAAHVREALAGSTSEAALDRLHRECRAGTPSLESPFALVEQVLVTLRREQGATRLAALIPADFDGLLDRYDRGRRAWETPFAGRIARYATNGAVNFWLRDPFPAAPGLVSHTLDLCARLAAIRFLLFTHPALGAIAAPDAGNAAHAAALDRAVVEVVYTFSRAVEHGDGTRERLCGYVTEHVRGRRRELDLVRF
jgi:lysine-N-methylase